MEGNNFQFSPIPPPSIIGQDILGIDFIPDNIDEFLPFQESSLSQLPSDQALSQWDLEQLNNIATDSPNFQFQTSNDQINPSLIQNSLSFSASPPELNQDVQLLYQMEQLSNHSGSLYSLEAETIPNLASPQVQYSHTPQQAIFTSEQYLQQNQVIVAPRALAQAQNFPISNMPTGNPPMPLKVSSVSHNQKTTLDLKTLLTMPDEMLSRTTGQANEGIKVVSQALASAQAPNLVSAQFQNDVKPVSLKSQPVLQFDSSSTPAFSEILNTPSSGQGPSAKRRLLAPRLVLTSGPNEQVGKTDTALFSSGDGYSNTFVIAESATNIPLSLSEFTTIDGRLIATPLENADIKPKPYGYQGERFPGDSSSSSPFTADLEASPLIQRRLDSGSSSGIESPPLPCARVSSGSLGIASGSSSTASGSDSESASSTHSRKCSDYKPHVQTANGHASKGSVGLPIIVAPPVQALNSLARTSVVRTEANVATSGLSSQILVEGPNGENGPTYFLIQQPMIMKSTISAPIRGTQTQLTVQAKPESHASQASGGAIISAQEIPPVQKKAGRSKGRPSERNAYLSRSANGLTMEQELERLLSEEERQVWVGLGQALPTRVPLSKAEERVLKRVRRKIKNKRSAQESRRKRKEYMDQIEKDNLDLKQRLTANESEKQALISQVSKLQDIIKNLMAGVHSLAPLSRTNAAGTIAMVMILFFATFMGAIGPLSTWNSIGYKQPSAVTNITITGSLPGALHASLTPYIDYEKYSYDQPTRTLLGGKVTVRMPWRDSKTWTRYLFQGLMQNVGAKWQSSKAPSVPLLTSRSQSTDVKSMEKATETEPGFDSRSLSALPTQSLSQGQALTSSHSRARIFYEPEPQNEEHGVLRANSCPSPSEPVGNIDEDECLNAAELNPSPFYAYPKNVPETLGPISASGPIPKAFIAIARYLERLGLAVFRLPLMIAAPVRANIL